MADAEIKAAPSYSVHAIHLVRTTQQIHVQLSAMADAKASILMGATFAVFTITLNQARSGGASLPMLVLGAFSFLAAVCAVVAIMPSFRSAAKAPMNLLFFGSFTRLSQDEYIDTLLPLLRADESVFRTMLTDIYQNGQLLQAKKYKFLRYSYMTFVCGLCGSLIVFLAQAIVRGMH